MTNASEAMGAILGTLLAVLALVGALWKWVVLPNLREQLFHPMREVSRQVTENKHANVTPTILDRLEDIEGRLTGVAETVEAIGLSQSAVLRMSGRVHSIEQRLGRHVGWSDEEVIRIWRALTTVMPDQPPQHRERTTDDESGNQGGP